MNYKLFELIFYKIITVLPQDVVMNFSQTSATFLSHLKKYIFIHLLCYNRRNIEKVKEVICRWKYFKFLVLCFMPRAFGMSKWKTEE